MSNELPTVSCYISDIDGALVIEVDGDAPSTCRVFMNDNRIAEVTDLDTPAQSFTALATSQNRVHHDR